LPIVFRVAVENKPWLHTVLRHGTKELEQEDPITDGWIAEAANVRDIQIAAPDLAVSPGEDIRLSQTQVVQELAGVPAHELGGHGKNVRDQPVSDIFTGDAFHMQPTLTSRVDAVVAVLHALIDGPRLEDDLGPTYAARLQEVEHLQESDAIPAVFV
jgi:hypothetical protein